jgi:hypothetical protein
MIFNKYQHLKPYLSPFIVIRPDYFIRFIFYIYRRTKLNQYGS